MYDQISDAFMSEEGLLGDSDLEAIVGGGKLKTIATTIGLGAAGSAAWDGIKNGAQAVWDWLTD